MRPNGNLVRALLIALTAATGCTSKEADTECTDAGPLRVATFNAGLARGDVAYADERATPALAALAAAEIDLLCMQEVAQDWDDLREATAAMPNAVHLPPLADCPTGSCSQGEYDPIAACSEEHCAGLVGPALMGCGADNCADELNDASAECLSCMVSTMQAGGGFTEVEAACLQADPAAGDTYLYDCSFDTGIVTSSTIVAQSSLRLDSYLVLTAVDHVRVETEAGQLDVFCTHLASDMPIDYEGDYDTWKGEQAAQIDQLLAFVDEQNDGQRPAVVLGDLNTGPAIEEADVDGEWPEHYQRLLDAGFTDPYADQQDAACTLCPDNTLRSDDSAGRLLDHILLKNAPDAAPSCERFMTDTVTIQTADGELESSPSDHYGLVMQLDPWCAR